MQFFSLKTGMVVWISFCNIFYKLEVFCDHLSMSVTIRTTRDHSNSDLLKPELPYFSKQKTPGTVRPFAGDTGPL